jgi:hypothetical protein
VIPFERRAGVMSRLSACHADPENRAPASSDREIAFGLQGAAPVL